jgi:hypothetical protein
MFGSVFLVGRPVGLRGGFTVDGTLELFPKVQAKLKQIELLRSSEFNGPAIVNLLVLSCPAQISRFIPTMVLDSVYRMFWRRSRAKRADIFNERLRIVDPFLANHNPTRPIVTVLGIRRRRLIPQIYGLPVAVSESWDLE